MTFVERCELWNRRGRIEKADGTRSGARKDGRLFVGVDADTAARAALDPRGGRQLTVWSYSAWNLLQMELVASLMEEIGFLMESLSQGDKILIVSFWKFFSEFF